MKQKGIVCRFLAERLDFGFWVVILFLVTSSAADDYRYEACAPKMCGNLSIRYPFYIKGQQESYCGMYSISDEVNCSNPATPLIFVPGNVFVIDSISYKTNSFRVHVDGVVNRTDCLPHIQNSTFYFPLNFSEESNLHFLSNCTAQLPGELLKYKRNSCSWNITHSWDLVMLWNDKNLGTAKAECKTNVVLPVETTPGEENGLVDYVGLLEKGVSGNWIAHDCDECLESGGRCGTKYTTYLFQCFCPDRPYRVRCLPRKTKLTPIILGTGLGGIILLLACCYIIFKKCTDVSSMLSGKGKTVNRELKALAVQLGSLAPKCYSYSNIKKMTNSFKDQLGKGGYGTVYKGRLTDGRHVAVKLLNAAKENHQDFINEIMSISRTSHVNVVSLLGFCNHGKRKALVYEYMPNGSLEKYILGMNNDHNIIQLGMDQLHQISLGVARGLEYLHRGCNTRILHFDIKPHNILLDEDFCPKISDFGLAKQYVANKESAVSSFLAARGTIGYIAPELISRCFGVVSHKSDVYSFGMMILEIVGRRKNVIQGASHASEVFFPQWAYQHLIIHKDLRLKGIVNDGEEDEISKKIILVGLWCIQKDPSLRPPMNKVIEMLEGNFEAIEIPPKPFFNNSASTSPSGSFNQRDLVPGYSTTMQSSQ